MTKKYLMTGLVAVALSGLFSGCSKEIETGVETTPEVNVLQKYENAFVSRFGQPAEDQDWGFGSASSGTRYGNPGENVPYTSDAINANANEWADATPGKTYGGWVVPDPLTDEQKALVRAYFQAVPNLTNNDPRWRHFFVQQVYKGHTTPPTTGNQEVTTAANGSSTYTSDNMNLLTVGHGAQHINDFNDGFRSWKGVLDKGYTANDYNNHHHSDQISLMVNIDDTSCFGYHNSGCNIQRNDKWALVGWETIRTWAREQHIYTEDILNDGWNRSFMGFDFELYSLEESYAREGTNKIYAPINDVPGNAPQYVWDGSKVMKRGIAPASSRHHGSRGVGVKIDGDSYFKVVVGDDPSDGDVRYMYNGSEIVGKFIFGGEGDPAVASSEISGYDAKITRQYIKFIPLVDSSNGAIYTQHESGGNAGKHLIIYDETAKKYVRGESSLTYESGPYDGNIVGGHVYKIYFREGDPITFFGMRYYVQGNTIADPDGETGNSNQGDDNNNQGGDNNNQGGGDNNQNEENYEYYGEDTYIIIDGEKIPYLKANMSMYGGIQRTLSDSDMKIPQDGKECLNLPAFRTLVADGYLPVKDTNLRTWVKWQGGDGYFSDWIVTLTEAKKIDDDDDDDDDDEEDPSPFVCRIIAEDLTVGENSDFDFNDVVFDVFCDGSTTTIRLRAAGGELPLTVAGHEVHKEFGFTNSYPLINTGWDGTLEYENRYVDFTIPGVYNTRESANTIPVMVTKKGKNEELVNILLKAEQGKVASKVCVGRDYKWCRERQDIDDKYHIGNGIDEGTRLFQQYIIGNLRGDWATGNAWYQQVGK